MALTRRKFLKGSLAATAATGVNLSANESFFKTKKSSSCDTFWGI